MPEFTLSVNGSSYTIDADGATPLLFVLMDDLQLNGPKFGCGLSQCGACTVLLNSTGQDLPIRSCVRTLASIPAGAQITTIEGLGTPEKPHPIQRAFIEEQAAQCAFCISGIMLHGKAYIDQHPNATQEEILRSLDGPPRLLCRCYTHVRMVRALLRYAQEVRP